MSLSNKRIWAYIGLAGLALSALLVLKVQSVQSQSTLALVYSVQFTDLSGNLVSEIYAAQEDMSNEVKLSGNGPGWENVPTWRDFPKWSFDKSKVSFVAKTNSSTGYEDYDVFV